MRTLFSAILAVTLLGALGCESCWEPRDPAKAAAAATPAPPPAPPRAPAPFVRALPMPARTPAEPAQQSTPLEAQVQRDREERRREVPAIRRLETSNEVRLGNKQMLFKAPTRFRPMRERVAQPPAGEGQSSAGTSTPAPAPQQ
ncbi:MAG: hypothetical protein QM765_15050 [Myxococcales bacterium]